MMYNLHEISVSYFESETSMLSFEKQVLICLFKFSIDLLKPFLSTKHTMMLSFKNTPSVIYIETD